MTYTRHNWISGDVVSAARLNNIENGVENAAALVKHNASAGGMLDCSYNDLLAEVNAGKIPYLCGTENYPYSILHTLRFDGGTYEADFGVFYCYASDPDEALLID